ncbi:isopentenyl-diphosphate Delta-isomerase [Candidatus Beckwithbacteria bacterium]|nr:isopentenyl-diphosphate Delta-isomerase [Candidatus Beckwithbacteria bacterium]
MTNIILVNPQDQQIGEVSKLDAHLFDGKLHRAFTVLLKNKNDEFLLTTRSLKKALWPTFWDGSFSSHPNIGEDLPTACRRRAKEELGIEIKPEFKELFSYSYHIKWNEFFSEYEVNHVLLGNYDGNFDLNPEEIKNFKWLKWPDLIKFCKKSNKIAPWFSLALKKIDPKTVFLIQN